MRGKITKVSVDALRPGDVLSDTIVQGFVVRRLRTGTISYGIRYRAGGRQRWLALGIHGRITPDQARRLAKKRIGEVADNRDPTAEREAQRARANCTVNVVLDAFVERHVRDRLRTAREIERLFDRCVRPRIGNRSIYALRRRDVVELLDAIEDESGAAMADRVLAFVRRALNWQAARDDDFTPPIVRGMARTKPRERARKRILDDEEIGDLWTALDIAKVPAAFKNLVRVLLLTGQRRKEIAGMSWLEVEGDVWVIAATRRWKGGENTVPLTKKVREYLGTPKASGFLFSTTNGQKPFSGFSKCKAVLDGAIAKLRQSEGRPPMPRWTLHDLRRTSRSLMSCAGVSADHAERVVGHVIPGVRGVYDRHSFFEEKKDALERLAILMQTILEPPAGKVVALRRSR